MVQTDLLIECPSCLSNVYRLSKNTLLSFLRLAMYVFPLLSLVIFGGG